MPVCYKRRLKEKNYQVNMFGGRSQITLCIFHGFLTTHPPMVMFYVTAKVKIQANGYILPTTHTPQ